MPTSSAPAALPRLGAHMSIAGGPAQALYRGASIGCAAIQMFTRNANRWSAKDLTPEEIAAFHRARAETGIDPVVAHSSYLINLGSPDEALWQRSVEALVTELERCQQLGIDRYVLHPGSCAAASAGETAVEEGLERVARGLARALQATEGVTILVEIMAGQGAGLGRTFEELRWLLEHATPGERLGVCFDMAHALAAGYEYRDAAAYEAMWAAFEASIGRARLGCIHLNDSKRDLGSHVDRHTHIGEGYVGLEAFRLLLNDSRLHHVPMLLETPKEEDLADDVRNLATLRALLESPVPQPAGAGAEEER